MSRVLIGLGSADRGDDAAGLEVARRVTGVAVKRIGVEPSEMLDAWTDDDDVVIVDAMQAGLEPGTVRKFDAHVARLPTGDFVTTHAFGPAEVIELARTLNRLPHRLTVYGIQTADVGWGAPLSPQVERAVESVVAEIDDA